MKHFSILLLLIFLASSLVGQHLIERTRLNLKSSKKSTPNLLSKKVKERTQLEKVDVFTLNENSVYKSNNDIVYLNLEKKNIHEFATAQNIVLLIPVAPGRTVELFLYRSRNSSADLIVKDQDANVIPRNGNSHFFRGIVSDDPGSLAALSVFENEIQLVISDSYGNYNLGKLRNDKTYALLKESTPREFNFECHVSPENALYVPKSINSGSISEGRNKNNTTECVKIHVEADFETYKNFGNSDPAVTNFIEGVFNVVATIYENESIPIELSGINIWHSNDPYNAETNVGSALQYLNVNVNSFNGDLFHLVSAIGNTGSFAGIANTYCNDPFCNITKTTALCNPDPFAVSQTQLYYDDLPNYSWTVNVFTHEMGHNMGSPHTFSCQWGPNENQAIDGCVGTQGGCANPGIPPPPGGTIMSYCHFLPNVGISLADGFGQQVGDHIRGQYANASCLTACSGNNCATNLMVSSSPVQGIFEASNIIQTSTGVRVLSSASFSAPNIELGPDFTIDNNAIFDIMTVGCNQ